MLNPKIVNVLFKSSVIESFGLNKPSNVNHQVSFEGLFLLILQGFSPFL